MVLLPGLLSGSVQAAGVSWKQGTTPPAAWTLTPAHPGPSDVITFVGPTKIYSNSCMGEGNLGGTPQLSVDPVAKVILLWFKGPAPTMCPLIYLPVCGLEGEFGPLAPGDWTFTSLSKELDFELTFTVKGAVAPIIYYVDGDAPGPVHDGTTWSRAFQGLGDALLVAGSGDEIRIAEGVYKPDQGVGVTAGDRSAAFALTEDLTLRGGFAGYGHADPDARDSTAHETILSGDLSGDDQWGVLNVDDNSYHVIIGPTGELPAMLDGLTVTAGRADGEHPNDSGGGLYNPGGGLDIVNCKFRGNTGVWGGGIMNLGATIRLVSTELIGNRALMLGGGLYNYSGDAMLHNCRVVGNNADYAEVAGGAALYNLDGTLTILSSTIADNRSSGNRAISSFTWDPSAGMEIRVTNSVLYNGGDELWSNNPSAIEVTYCDVQGGWTGASNLSADPQFVSPGVRSIEGEWIDGDYRLQNTSPAIDAGNDGALPADVLDLDADGNVTEQLPWDLDDKARVQGERVNLGAYEQGTAVPVTPGVGMTVCIGANCIQLLPDPNALSASHTYIGHTNLQIELNSRLKLTVTVTATSPVGGTWTGWVVPDVVGPGSVVVELWIKGTDLNLGALPEGSTNVQVAEVKLFGVPAP